MTLALAYLSLLGAVVAAGAGVWLLVRDRLAIQEMARDLLGHDARLRSLRGRWNRRFAQTRLGAAVEMGLEEWGVHGLRPLDALGLFLLATALIALVTGRVLSWFLAPVAVLMVVPAGLALVQRRKHRRRERFIGQMPQLARILSNATNAGLSIRTAVDIAAEEMPEPANSEMARVAHALAIGESLERALEGLEERLPAREVAVLVSTLIVSSRAGGSLITSLRNIADTLEERKQTRREVQTLLAEARSTALLIPVVGVGSLFLLDTVKDNAIDHMLSQPLGQLIFLAALAMYAIGFLVFRHVTRVDV